MGLGFSVISWGLMKFHQQGGYPLVIKPSCLAANSVELESIACSILASPEERLNSSYLLNETSHVIKQHKTHSILGLLPFVHSPGICCHLFKGTWAIARSARPKLRKNFQSNLVSVSPLIALGFKYGGFHKWR